MGEKQLAADYQRSYYLERKRLGLCVKCGRKVEAGMSQCGLDEPLLLRSVHPGKSFRSQPLGGHLFVGLGFGHGSKPWRSR